MKSKWSDDDAARFVAEFGGAWGEKLALRTYSSRLIGGEKELVLHGGGNTSVKGTRIDIFGKRVPAVFVKASGTNLAFIGPEGHTAVDLEYLLRLSTLSDLSDDRMVDELLAHRFDAHAGTPSIETLMHAFLQPKYIDHTHADAILALTNRENGKNVVRDALGEEIIIVDYVRPGFPLARAAADAYEASRSAHGMVLMKHGLVTWGETAKESYERTIALVTRAEQFLARQKATAFAAQPKTSTATAVERYRNIAPVLRGLLAIRTGNTDWPFDRFILRSLINDRVLAFLESKNGKAIALTPSLTADHLIRTKAFPLWIDAEHLDNHDKLKGEISGALLKYAKEYDAYVERHAHRLSKGVRAFDPMPRVILMPGVGAICAGKDAHAADIARDICAQTLEVKAKVAAAATYEGLSEEHLFDMEYFSLQHAKLRHEDTRLLRRSVALVTGAAGAIGFGICRALLDQGCHVVATDLAGDHLNSLANDFGNHYRERFAIAPLDVTDPGSVARGFASAIQTWGGVDLVIANAGAAHVSSLAEMDVEAFRRLERINVDGTLNVLAEAARHLRIQGTGGDIVLVTTKNVFAPGAKFGAYSATKAAAHQLARIASLELAEIDVRVNMVSPDAVFGHGERKSGLWAEVGPERMRARGLDESGLEEYYRQRNLLKAKITAEHVARAVLFFATRQTPTTGATIPVDGGLPDATPR